MKRINCAPQSREQPSTIIFLFYVTTTFLCLLFTTTQIFSYYLCRNFKHLNKANSSLAFQQETKTSCA